MTVVSDVVLLAIIDGKDTVALAVLDAGKCLLIVYLYLDVTVIPKLCAGERAAERLVYTVVDSCRIIVQSRYEVAHQRLPFINLAAVERCPRVRLGVRENTTLG